MLFSDHCVFKFKGTKSKSNSSSAFTLIEMLVVVAIIGIISAMLAPALQRALSNARKLQCTMNQKQMYAAFAMYADHFNGYLPPSYVKFDSYVYMGVSRTNPWIPWHSVIMIGQFADSDAVCSTAWAKHFRKPSELFICPEGEGENSETEYLPDTWIGYNSRFDNKFSRTNTPIKFANFSDPSRLMLLVDVVSSFLWERMYIDEPGYNGEKWPEYRHDGVANVLYADGHTGSTFNLELDVDMGEIKIKAK